MGRTEFQSKWINEFPWVSRACDRYKAFCNICNKEFKIDGSGRQQVLSHQRCHSIKDGGKNKRISSSSGKGQMVFSPTGLLKKVNVQLSIDDQVCRAETYRALKVVASNYSFASTNDDAELFKLMFENNPVAEKYAMAETKVKYVVQFGIAPYCKEMIVSDLKGCPFTFKFDETTNRMVKKQYDGYFQYWSPKEDCVLNVYGGSIFIGHCDSNNLVEHFHELLRALEVEPKYLLHLGMDGPNVNLSFQEKLLADLAVEEGKTFLKLGTCSLHPAHTAFRKGIKKLTVDLDSFFVDIHFFSSCQAPDERIMHHCTH